MKQVLQSLKGGRPLPVDVPAPRAATGSVVIRSSASLVSAGTERMLVEFGSGGLLFKARQQPDKVKMVLDKMRSEGIGTTLETVASKLDQPLALGYCNVGRVLEVGERVASFSVGERLASNGPHAEVVSVPENLCARIPDSVSDEAASFTILGAIALQGIRLANPTIGECVVVTGLGLIGLLAVQILKAHGCRVLGIDFDSARLALAREFGAEVANPSAGDDVLAVAEAFSRGRGVDAVIITASTQSSEPVSQAARMCRKRGRIVLVGVTGLELSRADFYEKELTFQVSCSYGPGRYDPEYEEQGHDYPIGFVRWTEQRNFEAVLDLMASGSVNVEPLISHRFPIERAAEAFSLLASDEPSLGILLEYDQEAPKDRLVQRSVSLSPTIPNATAGVVGFLGSGNYASRVLMPAFRAAGVALHTVVSGGGASAVHFGHKFGFSEAASDPSRVLENPQIDTVVIATRHDAHASQVLAALRSGKHVFCEKPLCLTLEELTEIEGEIRNRNGQRLMVGFNRRFAPHTQRIKAMLKTLSAPSHFIMTVNAGEIPLGHWTQDPAVGGGRIVGEACHFIDLLRYLAGVPIAVHHAVSLGPHDALRVREDKSTITLHFADGSIGSIHYLANGHRAFPKERLEVFCGGRVLQLDNFRNLKGWGWPGFSKMKLWRQDKGASACAAAFVASVKSGSECPIPLDELLETSRVSIEVAESLR
ncbi:MAG: bi-domain-containing oxidoreductase [Pseudomonadales bacterium]|nr:bi-domain-containing oxidoreductase [Pseudomonadales bacterium]